MEKQVPVTTVLDNYGKLRVFFNLKSSKIGCSYIMQLYSDILYT